MHWGRIFRNMFSNWAAYIVTALIGFFLAPVVVHALGNTGYGLWTLVLSLTGYFGLLDLGIRSSVGRFVTRSIALDDQTSVNRTTSTALVMLGTGGLLAFAATIVIATFFFGSFGVDPQQATSARIALMVTGLNMSLILPLGVFSAVLIALERFDIVSGVTIVGELTRAALVIWFLRHGYGLVALALIALTVTVAQYSTYALIARKLYRPLRVSSRNVNWAAGRELFGFSIYRFIWIVANQLIFYSDSVVIGLFLGAGAITPYAIAGSLINYGRNIVALVTDTLSPSAARMDAEGDRAGLQRLLIVGTRIALLVTLPLCIGFLFLGRQFIELWMGEAYVGSAVFLTVLTIPQFGSMPQYVSALILAGVARHKALAYMALFEGIANITLSIILVRRMGLIGVAWGTVITHLLCTTIVVPLYTLRVLHMRVSTYIVDGWIRPLACAIPIVGLGYLFSLSAAGSWLHFLGRAAVLCGVFAVMSYFICLDRRQRALAAAKIGVMFQRESVA